MKHIIVISSAGVDPKFIRGANVVQMPAYAMTKAAALVATTKYALILASEGFVVVSLSPGLVDVSGTIGEHGEQPEATQCGSGLSDIYLQEPLSITRERYKRVLSSSKPASPL